MTATANTAKTARRWYIPAGSPVMVRLADGRFVKHTTKEVIWTEGAKGCRNPMNPDSEEPYATLTVKGYVVVYDRNWESPEKLCTCGGRGEVDTILYGINQGKRVRGQCGYGCTYRGR